GNLNYDYLKNTGILQQFGLYWKLKNGSTETQTILGKEDPQALQQFKAVIEKHQEITFSKEKIANGKAFEGLDTYLKNLKVPKEEIESITSALGLSKTGGTIELVALTSLLKSKNSNIRDIASQVLSGYNHNKTVAEADVGTLGKGTIRDMLQQLSTAYACSDIEESLHSIANDPKNPEKTFTLDLKITDLYKAPKSRDKVVKVIETYIKNADVPEKDRIILQKIIAFIQASYKSQTMETVVSNKVVQGQLGALAGKINKKQGKDANFNAQLAAVKSDKSVEKFVENVNKATVFNQEAKTEIKEQTVELDEQVFRKILTLLQLDPIEFSREKLMNSAALRDELMNRIGGNMEWLEKQLTEQEKKQLWRLQSDMVSLIKEDLLTRQKFGTMGSYHTDNQKELRTFHPALAAQREALEIKNYDISNALYQDLSTQKNYMSSGSINVQSIQNLPAGTPFQLDTNTIFTLSTNGSCSIITPYSIQIIPPEKTNIALGYISAARIFPGLDFMGGLHETLQSYWNSPVLAKMKDGVSNREQCNLIKHYASALGIEGYNQLADTPDALVQSIKNSLPIGTSFWELAKNRGLLRKDGTINPLALGKTFEVQYDYNKPERYQNITKEEEMLIHG
ncbi:MAG: hypothetical protein PHU93_04520, partial [Candidatus Gracilibacteria bacterium]|nr:hypothetical protein [Candidatus Gracilibacteria bacterium]